MSLYLLTEPQQTSEISFLSFDLREALEKQKKRVLENPSDWKVGIYIEALKPLACIYSNRDLRVGSIILHPLLNNPSTPRLVIDHILIHELIHLIVPPSEENGKKVVHTEVFWRMEKMLSDNRSLAMGWLHLVFYGLLKTDKIKEGIFVKRGWKQRREKEYLSIHYVECLLKQNDNGQSPHHEQMLM